MDIKICCAFFNALSLVHILTSSIKAEAKRWTSIKPNPIPYSFYFYKTKNFIIKPGQNIAIHRIALFFMIRLKHLPRDGEKTWASDLSNLTLITTKDVRFPIQDDSVISF